MKQRVEFPTKVALMLTAWLVWWWAAVARLSPAMDLAVIVGGAALVFPVSWVGRKILDQQETASGVTWITTLTQFGMGVGLGASITRALVTHRAWPGWEIPVPSGLAAVLVAVTGAAALLTVANLALRGLGAPFFIALSRRVAEDWLYRWTRNPMVLAALAFLVALGLRFRSAWFVLWAVLLVAPAMLFFVKVFEERELEIRFGAPYREYKARTPLLIPGRRRERKAGEPPPQGKRTATAKHA